MLFHVYQGKNITFSGKKIAILQLPWLQAQYVTRSQVPHGKAVQRVGGKARTGRKGCCPYSLQTLFQGLLQKISLFAHYKYQHYIKSAFPSCTSHARRKSRAELLYVTAEHRRQHPYAAARTELGCPLLLSISGCKAVPGPFRFLCFYNTFPETWFHKAFELPCWRKLNFFRCQE